MFLGEAAQHRRGDENDDGGLQQRAAAVEIAQLAIDRRRGGRGEEVPGDDPRQVLEAVELAGNGRQGGGDDALIERRQHHAEQDAAEDDEDLAMAEGLAAGLRLDRRHCPAGPVIHARSSCLSQRCAGSRMTAPQHSNRLSSGHPAG
jgi:hypothetical protein